MTRPVRTLILAGSFSEAAKYAKGMQLRQYRYAVNAHSVANFRPDDVVELPGYESRRDKHAFKSIIRLAAARGVEVRKDEYIPPPPPPEPQYGEEGYVADFLLGDATVETLRRLGATDDEIQKVQDRRALAGKVAAIGEALIEDEKKADPPKPRGRPPGSKNKPRVNASKAGGSIQPYKPKPDEQLIKPATDVDDLFED